MTREVDGYSGPYTQGSSTSTGGGYHRCWDLRCSQMRTLRWKVW